MDEIATNDERPALDTLSLPDLDVRLAQNRSELAKLSNASTVAELRRVRELTAENRDIVAIKAELAPEEEVADEPVETPAADEPAAPAAEPTADQVADVVAEAEQIAADAPQMQTASTGTQFRPMSEDRRPAGAVFRSASANGAGVVERGDEVLTVTDIGKKAIQLNDNPRARGEVYIASARTLDESWDYGFVGADESEGFNTRVIRKAQSMHRQAREASAVHTAAPNPLTFPVGTEIAWRDIPNCYATQNGIEILNRIADVPASVGRQLCEVKYQLAHNKADFAGAAQLWTQADQDAVDPDDPTTWKPTFMPPAIGTAKLSASAVVVGYETERCYGIQNPEAVENDLHILSSLVNDVKVSYQLGRFEAEARRLTIDASTGFGAFVEIRGIMRAIKGFLASEGLAEEADYACIYDAGLLDLIGYDIDAANGDSDGKANLAVRSEIKSELATFGEILEVSQTEVTRTSPWTAFKAALPAAGAAPVPFPPVPRVFKIRVVDFSQWFKLRPEGVAFGIKDDYNKLRQNRIVYFGEDFLGTGKNGCNDEFSIEVTLNFDGARQIGINTRGNALPLFV